MDRRAGAPSYATVNAYCRHHVLEREPEQEASLADAYCQVLWRYYTAAGVIPTRVTQTARVAAMKEAKTPGHESAPISQKLAIQFDAQDFVHFLAESDLTEAEKLEYVQTIWAIVLQFVDMGFGLHPIQQASGQLSENRALRGDADVLGSSHSDVCKD